MRSPGHRDVEALWLAPPWHGSLPYLSVPEDEVIWHHSQAGVGSGNLASWLSFAACHELGAVQVLLMLLFVVVGAVGSMAGRDAGWQARRQQGSSPLQKGCNLHYLLFKGA